jgi:hypothetical protein
MGATGYFDIPQKSHARWHRRGWVTQVQTATPCDTLRDTA